MKNIAISKSAKVLVGRIKEFKLAPHLIPGAEIYFCHQSRGKHCLRVLTPAGMLSNKSDGDEEQIHWSEPPKYSLLRCEELATSLEEAIFTQFKQTNPKYKNQVLVF